jgi:hypothetical protein
MRTMFVYILQVVYCFSYYYDDVEHRTKTNDYSLIKVYFIPALVELYSNCILQPLYFNSIPTLAKTS